MELCAGGELLDVLIESGEGMPEHTAVHHLRVSREPGVGA
jgi:hypothetical protein